MMSPLITALQTFFYFVLIVLALQQLQIDLSIIYVFITPIAWGVGLGIGAAIAIIVGFGLRDRAPQMMDNLVGTIEEEASKVTPTTDPLTDTTIRDPPVTDLPRLDECRTL